ncbi:hypothetical protein [Tessaracoccus sp. G1721]
MSDQNPRPADEAAVDDAELRPTGTEGPDEGEHLHSSDHAVPEEDIEADRRHQETTPTQP